MGSSLRQVEQIWCRNWTGSSYARDLGCHLHHWNRFLTLYLSITVTEPIAQRRTVDVCGHERKRRAQVIRGIELGWVNEQVGISDLIAAVEFCCDFSESIL